MKILVAYKRVVDYNVRIQVKPDGTGVVTDGVKLSPNPFDEIALEEALRLRDKGVKSVRSRAPGDLYCKVVVETPVNLTSEQRELLEQFEATFVGDGARRRRRARGAADRDGRHDRRRRAPLDPFRNPSDARRRPGRGRSLERIAALTAGLAA